MCLAQSNAQGSNEGLIVNGFVAIQDFHLAISRRECHYPPICTLYPPIIPDVFLPLQLQFRKETFKK